MDKQELERQRKQILAEKKQIYMEHPELAKWVQTRRILRNILLVYWILHSVFSIILMLQMQSGGIVMETVKLLVQLLWICAFLNPEGGWRLNLIIYIWALVNFGLLAKNASLIMVNLFDVISYIPHPNAVLYGVVLLMEVLAPFLLLAFALYLTAAPKRRAMSEEAEAVMKETMQKMKSMVR